MKQRVVVIGLGIFGMNLVKELCNSGVEVIAIDKSKDSIQKARDCATKAIVADGTDPEIMNAIGLREDDIVVVSFGEDLAASTLITRTISIIFAAAFSVFLITSVLLLAEAENLQPLQSRHFFVEYLFETTSAFGTVGLSMGVTPKLNDLQKLAIILIMFAGRVGPLTLAFSLARRGTKTGIAYAEESVMVG